jgi:diguanylate cyclase (GGDEF)-like protein/PAS domain S-box-containing protein
VDGGVEARLGGGRIGAPARARMPALIAMPVLAAMPVTESSLRLWQVASVVATLLAATLLVFVRRSVHLRRQAVAQMDLALRDRLASEELLQALLRHADDVVAVVTPAGWCEYVSSSADRLLGVQWAAARGRPLDALLGPAAEPVLAELRSVVRLPGMVASSDVVYQHPDGRRRVLHAVLSNLTHDLAVSGVVLNLSDVTERRSYEELLAHQATHDSLTGLVNRNQLRGLIERTWQHAASAGRSFAVLFGDLDGFKRVNDHYGHEVGDVLLKTVADRIRHAIRVGDVALRYGGDEFVVVCPDTDPIEAELVAQRLAEAVARPVVIGPHRIDTGVSVGLAVGEGPIGDIDALVRHADEAMYVVKGPKRR